MLRLAKAFWDLALWRITPAQLPASLFLLCLAATAAAALEVAGALLPPAQSAQIPVRIALAVLLPLGFTWAVLYLSRLRQRFLQTSSALLGVAALAELVLYPLDSLLTQLGVNHPAALPLGFLSFVGLVWYLLACAHIWRAALNAGLGVGIAVSVGYLVLSVLLERYLLPEA